MFVRPLTSSTCPTAGENQPGDEPERLQRQIRHLEFRNHHGERSVVTLLSLTVKVPLTSEFFSLFPSQIELAILRFPYDSWGTPFQQLKQVVEEPSPQLPAGQFSPEFVDFSSQWWAFLSSCCFSPVKSTERFKFLFAFLPFVQLKEGFQRPSDLHRTDGESL